VAIVDDRFLYRRGPWHECRADVVVSLVRVNDLQRINRFLIACGERLRRHGHFVGGYEPLEQVKARIEAKYGVLARAAFLLHFAWFRAFPKLPFVNALYFLVTRGKNRDLSKAEVWGRLSFCGFRVIAEEPLGGTRFVTAQRMASPITNKRPSYYPVVGLTKVGLDGTLIRTHKVRSMYPYSEFLQKQIFEEHGLVGTGKFKNDFRLTEYGRWLRRYWIDEVPQIYDWLRGDIKIAGLRATSPHYLSLYPKEFIDLYTKVKPGLVPPLFNESTQGFEQVVAVEMAYLEAYMKAPILTDLQCLWATFQDIVFRGVRSK
jgi:lipopolysaccharide/colanic/teichoic acid biosynthesis glycosyltransferase